MQPTKTIQEQLFQKQDLGYRDFQAKLIPTLDKGKMIGVRIPELRKIAKNLWKKDNDTARKFLEILPHQFYEEYHLHSYLISENTDLKEVLHLTKKLLPFIDNWAVCDGFVPKVFAKHPDEIYEKIKIWLKNDEIYIVRFAINLLLSLYLKANFKAEMLDLVANVKRDEYYIEMAQAWFFSMAAVRNYSEVVQLLDERKLTKFAQNKTIAKIRESRQFTSEQKDFVNQFKM